ncbi:hypothetical protein ASPWEDRAFT_22955 [Aspergillus wentii DTO 134E9]|uniref:VWFA domain-containing protein n=1 Tax=Aspergillus wentii DTO 134E9 TaxID=1073089 RepID=A0A1L9S105_ASPWE|nr:uncharacterized protein ASPWEDRAFT_22955 [Aspergillus wentii DTO 134E9]OJJ40808.1 hypothetical protein ASPWEDRAFT_22955 [Aspergillus wentii DTO 134E9]
MDVLDKLQSGLFFTPSIEAVAHAHLGSIEKAEEHEDTPLPLLSLSVDVDIQSRVSTTKVTQQFTNPSESAAQNARYIFPVYDESVITSFRCWVGPSKMLEGIVKPKEVARAEFQHAVSQKKAAVLVEEMTPEIFETNVGNIPPHSFVRVEIAYTNLLKIDNCTGGLVLTIPTSIAPRYGAAPEQYTQSTLPAEGLRINIQASMSDAICKMESRSHPISVELGAVAHQSFQQFTAGAASGEFDPSKARASLSNNSTVLDRDFVLFILSAAGRSIESQAVAESHSDDSGCTVAVTINPGSLFLSNIDTEGFNGEIIFIVDQSDSMNNKIRALRDVTNVLLRSLPEDCHFNICSFGSTHSWLWPASQSYNQDSLQIATQHAALFNAYMGGTEILGALQSVESHYNSSENVPTNVIVLTDGEVWDVDSVTEYVRSTSSNIRYFALGIGDLVSHRLVEGIGKQGGGYAEVVSESVSGSWQGRVIQMLKAAMTPSRLRCEVDLGLPIPMDIAEGELPFYIQAPYHIPPLGTFSNLTLYYMVQSNLDTLPESIIVTATTDYDEILIAQMPLRKSTNSPAIHHLAAKALMADYESGHSWIHSHYHNHNPTTFQQILQREAEQLGQKWSITGKWTSYVAVDHDSQESHEASLYQADREEIRSSSHNRQLGSPGGFCDYNPDGGFSPTSPGYSPNSPVYMPNSPGFSPMSPEFAPNSPEYSPAGMDSPNYMPTTPIRSPGDTHNICSPSSPSFSPGVERKHLAKELSLLGILQTQSAEGEFQLSDTATRYLLESQFMLGVEEQLIHGLVSEDLPEEHPIRLQAYPAILNIIVIAYVTYRHAESKDLWELQIAKARRWAIKTLAGFERFAIGEKGGLKEVLSSLEKIAISRLLDNMQTV